MHTCAECGHLFQGGPGSHMYKRYCPGEPVAYGRFEWVTLCSDRCLTAHVAKGAPCSTRKVG